MMGDSMNECRGYSAACVSGDAIYVIGGLKDNDEILDTVSWLSLLFKILIHSCLTYLSSLVSFFWCSRKLDVVGGMLQGRFRMAIKQSKSHREKVLLLSHCVVRWESKCGCFLPSKFILFARVIIAAISHYRLQTYNTYKLPKVEKVTLFTQKKKDTLLYNYIIWLHHQPVPEIRHLRVGNFHP